MSDNDSYEENSSGDQDFPAFQPNLHDSISIGDNPTNISMHQPQQHILKVLNCQFSEVVKTLYQQLFPDKMKYLKKPFGDYIKISKFKYLQINNADFDLDCIPIFILVDPRIASLQMIEKELRRECSTGRVEHHQSNDKNKSKNTHNNYVKFFPTHKYPFYFKVKPLPPHGKDKEADLLIDKLFEFHLNAIPMFNMFAGYLFHWASNRRILDEKYLPVPAFKIIIVLFLSYFNFPSVIDMYMSQYKKELDKADEYIDIGPKGTYQANAEVINNFPNFILEERKGFFLKSQNKYDVHFTVRKIPFPMVSTEAANMRTQFQKKCPKTFQNLSVGSWIYQFFKWCNRLKISENASVKIDLMQKEKFKIQSPCATPCLDVIHPVFGYNITQHLRTNREDFVAVCKQFKMAFDYVVTGQIEEMLKITERFIL